MSAAGHPLRLGLIGCGRLAELGYAPAIARLGEVELVAVADPDRERRDAVGGPGRRRPAPYDDGGGAGRGRRGARPW